MITTLLHCGKRRLPYRRVDIYPPAQKLYAERAWIDAGRFESIAVFEYRCTGCYQARSRQSVFAWMGFPYKPKEKPTPLFKIPNKHLDKWLSWMQYHPLPLNRKGVMTVQGSESQWPYRFRAKISIR